MNSISKVPKQFDHYSKATEFKICSKTQLTYYLRVSVKAKTNYILRIHFDSEHIVTFLKRKIVTYQGKYWTKARIKHLIPS